jgi:hypothetical protein
VIARTAIDGGGIVYATAQQQGAELLTCDAHFKGLPGVMLFSKAS